VSSLRRLRKLLLVFWIGGSVAVLANGPDSALKLSADIAPRPVAEALAAFGRQTGLQLIYVSTIAETQQSRGARAGLTASEALAQLLDGTGLAFEFLNARTVRIFPAPTVVPTAVAAVPTRPQHATPHPSPGELALEEVTVTARRSEEAQSHVPISMAVLSMEDLRNSGVTSIDEVGALVPSVGFSMTSDAGAGNITYLNMRGVNGRNTSTTGIYIDDTPIPRAAGFTYLRSFPYTFDLDRIEVLRGPQLQLFGEGNQAGGIRFIYSLPNLTAFTAFAESDVALPAFGEISYGAGVAAGGPLIRDVLGFRLSAWVRSDGGFVDRVDPFTGAVVDKNADHTLTESFRGALRLAASDTVQIVPSLVYSSFRQHDSQFFYTELSDAAAGQLRNGVLLRQPYDDSSYVGALRVTASLGAMELGSVSSYFHRSEDFWLDITPGVPVDYSDVVAQGRVVQQRMLMQELRLRSTDFNALLSWDIGAFYSTTDLSDTENLSGALGDYSLPGTHLTGTARTHQTRFAGFGEVSVRLAKGLTLNAGLHGEHASFTTTVESLSVPATAGTDSPILPQLRLSYQATEQQLLYLTAAKGYGTGGPWVLLIHCPGEPPPARIGEDTLWSYEAGAKSGLLDGHVQLDTSVFHMLWNNHGPGYAAGSAAVFPLTCSENYLGTPGPAVSNGFDLTVRALAGAHVRASVAVAYANAHYTRTITQGGLEVVRQGAAVGILPQVVSPWNVTASVEYSMPLSGGATALLRAEDIFRSRNPGPFQDDDPASPNYSPGNVPDPSTNLLNLRATLQRAGYDVALFLNNALDSRPTILRRYDGPPSAYATTFRPRTVGLSASWRY
jgi:outer membrane receptor protein involved in Fe transport